MDPVETEISKFENEEEFEEFEDEKKKKPKKGSKKEKKKKEVVVEIPVIPKVRPPETEPSLRIVGLKNVKLTSLTQKIIGCIVGEHVTAESPWTTVSKVVVDENLYLHHESSDFLPIKDELMDYADSTLLVGYDPNYLPYEGEDFHRFYIAVTESARSEVLAQLEEERRQTEERLKNSINKKILPWKSYGSETEVDDSIVTNTRPLIQLELETDIDELLKPVNFIDRNVEDAKDGYVRIGPGRHEFSGVQKLRVDASVQAVPALVPDAAQTDPGLPENAWTQYLYDMEMAEDALAMSEVKELNPDHVFPERNYLEKSLEYNETFDLYVNDYPLLVLNETDNQIPGKSFFDDYEAFTDVSHCKSKLITSIAWHPMWSGIVALAYSVVARCVTSNHIELTGDEVQRDVFSKNFVLLWSFKDVLKPRLILQSPREVTSIVWSPIDPNILVGGCASGQIIIWDLKGKLEAVETTEYLSPDQQKYRLVMQSLIGWVQPQPPAQYVRPAALSDIRYSHSGKVTEVQWISPYFEWTASGHYVKTSVDEGKPSMQVISSGEDGQIRVWDLNLTPTDGGGPGRPRKRARKRPSALTAQISPYKVYDRKIRPIYILYPELPSHRTSIKLTGLSLEVFPIKYKADVLEEIVEPSKPEEIVADKEKSAVSVSAEKEKQSDSKEDVPSEEVQEKNEDETDKKEEVEEEQETKPPKNLNEADLKKQEEVKKEETLEKPERADSIDVQQEESVTCRKIYKAVLTPPEEQPKQVVQVVTDEGDSITLRWEGFEFQTAEEITSEQGTVLSWGGNIHDGPVISCSRNPFLQHLILTVGGKVIALWNDELRNQPLFWKSIPVTATCGAWSPYRPCVFNICRSDGSLEVWDLTNRSDCPTVVQSISGKVLTSMSEHSLPLFGNLCILGVADFQNSFRLLSFPEEFKNPKPKELDELKDFINREIYIRQAYLIWNESFTKSNADELARMRAFEEENEKKRREAEQAAEQEAQLRAKMEEEEARQLAKGRHGNTANDKLLNRIRIEREKQMQRVLMEKKRLSKNELLAKQQPILMIKQMEKEKKRKQREKIRQQQKIFDKTVAMLFPEMVEKPQEGTSRFEEFEAEVMQFQPELMSLYDTLLPVQLKYIKDNPFNKRLRWEKVFEEGMWRRNMLDFPLYLRQKRMERYIDSIPEKMDGTSKGRVTFKGDIGELDLEGLEEEEEEEEEELEGELEEEVEFGGEDDEVMEIGEGENATEETPEAQN